MAKEQKNENRKKLTKIIGSSKRLTLTYIVFSVWIGLAIFAIIKDADFYGLAVYFVSGLPLIIGYLWSETQRPTIKDASDIIKNISNMTKYSNRGRGGHFYNNQYQDQYQYQYQDQYFENDNYNNQNYNNMENNNYNNNLNNEEIISIYSSDDSVELSVSQSQLITLMNIGYVDKNKDKFVFNITLLDQVKSLIDEKLNDPII